MDIKFPMHCIANNCSDKIWINDRHTILKDGVYCHSKCFKCIICQIALNSHTYVESNENMFMCKNCLEKIYTSEKCHADCQEPLIGNDDFIMIKDGPHFHLKCFKCVKCNKGLTIDEYSLNNELMCMNCRNCRQIELETKENASFAFSTLVSTLNHTSSTNCIMSESVVETLTKIECFTFIYYFDPIKLDIENGIGDNHNLGAYYLSLYYDENKMRLEVDVHCAKLRSTVNRTIYAEIEVCNQTKLTEPIFNELTPEIGEVFYFDIDKISESQVLELRDYRRSVRNILIGKIKIKLRKDILDKNPRWYYIQK